MSKKTEATPASIFRAALDKQRSSSGYRSEPVEGTLGRVRVVRSPDGNHFGEWGNGGNPKGFYRTNDPKKAREFAKDVLMWVAAVEVADELNRGNPATHLTEKAKASPPVGIKLTPAKLG